MIMRTVPTHRATSKTKQSCSMLANSNSNFSREILHHANTDEWHCLLLTLIDLVNVRKSAWCCQFWTKGCITDIVTNQASQNQHHDPNGWKRPLPQNTLKGEIHTYICPNQRPGNYLALVIMHKMGSVQWTMNVTAREAFGHSRTSLPPRTHS